MVFKEKEPKKKTVLKENSCLLCD